MIHGYLITAMGWEILANAVAGNSKLNIVGVAFGKGKLEEYENPATLTGLKDPVADGVMSKPVIKTDYNEIGEVKQSTVSFVAEYRSDFASAEPAPITGNWGADIDYDFNINEFAVYAEHPETKKHVLIYYATLGDTPHPVTSYSKQAIDIRRYPVSIALSNEVEVNLIYPPLAFVTSEEMQEYAMNTCLPVFLEHSQKQIDEHNVSPEAHPDIRKSIMKNSDRLAELEKVLNGESAKSFSYDFDTLDAFGITVGVYNESENCLEC